MKPIDYRNATWDDVRSRLTTDRLAVLEALREHGPCTTRELAAEMDWDVLSVRPRVTELVQLDFVEIYVPSTPTRREGPREGLYMARSNDEAMETFHTRRQAAVNPQLNLALK